MKEGRIYYSEGMLVVPINTREMIYLVKRRNTDFWARCSKRPFQMLIGKPKEEKAFMASWKPAEPEVYEKEKRPMLIAVFNIPFMKEETP
jgi:hypothetical protein